VGGEFEWLGSAALLALWDSKPVCETLDRLRERTSHGLKSDRGSVRETEKGDSKGLGFLELDSI
jgi:hypothetical protein